MDNIVLYSALMNASLSTAPTNNHSLNDVGTANEGDAIKLEMLLRVASTLYTVCAPVIVSLGTVGNVLTLLVMRGMSRGQSASAMSVYFNALAVSDLVLLYTGIFREWVSWTFGFELRQFHDFFCKTLMFLVYVCGMTSSWFLVCMTLQRVTSVMFPHRVGLLCTRKKTRVTVVTIAVFFIVLNTHILYGFTVVDDGKEGLSCQQIDDELFVHYDVNIFPWLDLTFSSLLPFTILIVGNSLLVWKVVQSLRVARTMTSSNVTSAGTTDRVAGREKKASSLTTTVISISVIFFCLTLPVCVYIILEPYLDFQNDKIYEAELKIVFDVCKLLWYSNSAMNFYLYCLTGSRFRSQLMTMFCKRSLSSKAGTGRSDVTISMTMASSQTAVSDIREEMADESADF